MFITMHRSGGFAAVPALSRKLSVDTATLPTSEAEHLESAVRAARIPELAQQSETQQPETQQPETQKPETQQPETQKPESQKPETRSGGPPKSGDRFLYHLTVNDGTASHTVTVTEPFADPALDTLIDLLSSYQ
jgi:hypothetical protein